MAMKIDPDMCTACGDCKPVCPTKAISSGKIFYKIDAATCTECDGHNDSPLCVDVCPSGCISPA
ncbi:MAG: 4Fe-4S binding protein [Azonexus sp.]|jgi:ferredoxin|nr:4Fe-4S binding protein [Dechloromonas sp.]MDX9944145.1 4Fe-4S binding protein [Azonexus sp.]